MWGRWGERGISEVWRDGENMGDGGKRRKRGGKWDERGRDGGAVGVENVEDSGRGVGAVEVLRWMRGQAEKRGCVDSGSTSRLNEKA